MTNRAQNIFGLPSVAGWLPSMLNGGDEGDILDDSIRICGRLDVLLLEKTKLYCVFQWNRQVGGIL